MPNTTNWISTAEAARALGVTPGRIRHLCQSGKLPVIKVGRDWLINPKSREFKARQLGSK